MAPRRESAFDNFGKDDDFNWSSTDRQGQADTASTDPWWGSRRSGSWSSGPTPPGMPYGKDTPSYVRDDNVQAKPEVSTGYRTLRLSAKKPVQDSRANKNDLYRKLNIPNKKIEEWSATMKTWLVEAVLKPLNALIIQRTELRKKPISSQLAEQSNFVWERSTAYNEQELSVISKFVQIENADVDFVVERIKKLSENKWLMGYKTEVGENISDTRILLHIFCTWMDLQMSQIDISTKNPFSKRYFVMTPLKPESSNSKEVIYFVSKNPPHVNLFINGEMWEVPSGSNNLFDALCLFIWHIKETKNGHLQGTSLKSLNLTEVVED
uniref:Uncharacterized protein n=1 Tax=Arcella intermedia TaxID=1963864 RepID=A0A6B2L9Q2_9EUKA